VGEGYRNRSFQGFPDVSTLEEHYQKLNTQRSSTATSFSTIQSWGDIELQALPTNHLPERDGGVLVTRGISGSKIKTVCTSSLFRLLILTCKLGVGQIA